MLDYSRGHSKRGGVMKFVAVLVGLGISIGCSAAETTLKLVSVFPRNHTFNIPVFEMIDTINAKGKGVLQVQFTGGPEAVPPTEQLAALQRGVFDIFSGAA